jgi:lipopolysaccharide biosynthesis glycosyltransferase
MQNHIKKINKAIVLGATGNMAFAAANVLIGIKKHSPELKADFVVFHNDFSDNDKNLINNIIPCNFFEYEIPINTGGLEQSSFSRYSKLAFSRYECFRMLNKYKQVLWVDIDILMQKDISSIFNYAKTGISLYQEVAPLQECFSIKVEGYNMHYAHYNSGVLLLSDNLKNYNEMGDWLYNKTYELATYLKYADQGIINLLVQEFKIEVDKLPEKYNCHSTKKMSKDACIVHSYSPQKFWKWYEKAYHFKEWDDNYKKWLKMGGSSYKGIKYRFGERWCKANIHHECPNPIRQPGKFVKFMLKGKAL